MTRINLGLTPDRLCDQHLLAEYRELPRILTMIINRSGQCSDIPKYFTLGKGHMKFFFNKVATLALRYTKIIQELQKRGFKLDSEYLSYVNKKFWVVYRKWPHLVNVYVPDPKEVSIIRKRVISRLPKKPRYYGLHISIKSVTKLLNK